MTWPKWSFLPAVSYRHPISYVVCAVMFYFHYIINCRLENVLQDCNSKYKASAMLCILSPCSVLSLLPAVSEIFHLYLYCIRLNRSSVPDFTKHTGNAPDQCQQNRTGKNMTQEKGGRHRLTSQHITVNVFLKLILPVWMRTVFFTFSGCQFHLFDYQHNPQN